MSDASRLLLARFRQWRAYKKNLAALMRAERRPVSPARYVLLRAQARVAARRVEDGHE